MFKLLITSSSGTVNATNLVRSITWSGDYQQCSRTLEFELISSSTDKNIPVIKCELGYGVTLMLENRTLFDGYIFERQKDTGSSIINITCYDRGIYLKRNEKSYKFINMTPEDIVRRIGADFNIPLGDIAATGIKIKRNFIGTNLYNIIQTAYSLASDKNNKKYMVRFNGQKLNVIEKKANDETLVIQGGSNLMSASTSESITNMINQVAIYNLKDQLVSTQKDENSIKSYGLFQSYLKQAKGENAIPKAKKIISDNGIIQKITIENLGNIANITGNTVVVKEPYTGLYGLFYIDSDIHTWKNGQYYNKLVINFKNIMDEQEAGSLPNKDGSKTGGTWEYLYKPGDE